jgi:hypothetical protein
MEPSEKNGARSKEEKRPPANDNKKYESTEKVLSREEYIEKHYGNDGD